MRTIDPSRSRGFTLIELLTVIAIIGVLAAIIIPAVGGVQTNALKTKTRGMFSQWTTALEQFRQDYGYVPVFEFPGDSELFVQVLQGDAEETEINPKNIRYYTFSQDAFGFDDDSDANNDDVVVDAFGNPNMGMAVDTNRDGEIDFTNGPPNLEDIDVPTPLRGTIVFWSEKQPPLYTEEVATWE